MKVIFIQNIDKNIRKGDIKNVSDGYACNHLFHKNLAVRATEMNLKKYQSLKAESDAAKANMEKNETETIDILKKAHIKITSETTDKGTLFKGIALDDILSNLKENYGLSFEKKNFPHYKSIKEIGDHEIAIKFHTTECSLKLTVEDESEKTEE
jgi:large subunit ribosomal protein L9